MLSPIADRRLMNAWMVTCVLAATPSVMLYALRPSAAVQNFGGTPSKSATFWCSLTAGGDAVISFLFVNALLGRGGDECRKIAIQANAFYCVFHMGGFWWHHTHGDPHPGRAPAATYIGSLAIALAAVLRWGL
jgi:hypothetical protein